MAKKVIIQFHEAPWRHVDLIGCLGLTRHRHGAEGPLNHDIIRAARRCALGDWVANNEADVPPPARRFCWRPSPCLLRLLSSGKSWNAGGRAERLAQVNCT